MSEKKQRTHNKQHKIQTNKLQPPQVGRAVTKDNLITVLLQISHIFQNIVQSSPDHSQCIIKWLNQLRKIQNTLQKQQKLQFFQQVIQIVNSQKKQYRGDNNSKITKKLIEFAEETLVPHNLCNSQLVKLLISVIQTSEKDSEKYVSLKDGGKILIRWHFFFSIFQNSLSRKLYHEGEYKSNKKIIQQIRQAKNLMKQVILQIFKNQKTQTMINSLICNLFICFQSLQFPICVLICQSFNELIKQQFSIQYSKNANNSYHGICSPDIIVYFLSQFLRLPRITIERQQCSVQQQIAQIKKEVLTNPKHLSLIMCSYCGENIQKYVSNQNQGQQRNPLSFQKIFINLEDQTYTLRICVQCQQNCGAYAYLTAVPLTANWRDFQATQGQIHKPNCSVIIESLLLKSLTKKQQKQHPQIIRSQQYLPPQRITINSIQQRFPSFLNYKILYFLFQNHPTQGLLFFVQDLRAKIQLMMIAKTNSFRNKTLKLVQSKIIHLLFQDKANFTSQIKNLNFLPQVMISFKQRIIYNWQRRMDEDDQSIVITCLELGTNIFCLQGNMRIIDKMMQFSQKVRNQTLITQTIKSIQKISNQRKTLISEHYNVQFDLLCICQILLHNKSIKSNSRKLKYSILQTAKQLISNILKQNRHKKQDQGFILSLVMKQILDPKFLVQIIGIDQTIFRLLTEILADRNQQYIEYIYSIMQQFLIQNRNQILENQNLLNVCFSRLINKQLQQLISLTNQYREIRNQEEILINTKKFLDQNIQFPKILEQFSCLLSFYKLALNQVQCQKLEKIQIQMIDLLKIASPFYIIKIASFISRVNYALKINNPKKYICEDLIYKNMNYKDLFNNQTFFERYYQILKAKKDQGSSIEKIFSLLLLVIYGILQIEKARIQVVKHQSWVKSQSLQSSKRRSSTKRQQYLEQREQQPEIYFKVLPFTLQVYQFLIKTLISIPQQTAPQIQRELFTILGQFWSQHPQLFSSSQMAVLHLLQKMNQSALFISLVYQSMLKTIALKKFEQKDQRSIQAIDKIFKKTQKMAFDISKEDIDLRIQFYKVLGMLLKVGKAFQHSYNKYIILGSCDTSLQIQQIIDQILKQQYSLDSSSLFFNLKQNLKFVKFQFSKISKSETLYNLNGIEKLFRINNQSKNKSNNLKTKKIDRSYNKRMQITLLKKIGEILAQHNQLDTDPDFFYFLLQIVSKAQAMSHKQFIEIYYSIEEIINQNLNFILSTIKKSIISQNYSNQDTNQIVHSKLIKQLIILRRVACIIFSFQIRCRMQKNHNIKQIQENIDTVEGLKDIKVISTVLVRTERAEKHINDFIQGNMQFQKVCSNFYENLKEIYSQYYQIARDSDSQEDKVVQDMDISCTVSFKPTKKFLPMKKAAKNKQISKLRNKSLPLKREKKQQQDQPLNQKNYNLRNRKKK